MRTNECSNNNSNNTNNDDNSNNNINKLAPPIGSPACNNSSSNNNKLAPGEVRTPGWPEHRSAGAPRELAGNQRQTVGQASGVRLKVRTPKASLVGEKKEKEHKIIPARPQQEEFTFLGSFSYRTFMGTFFGLWNLSLGFRTSMFGFWILCLGISDFGFWILSLGF